MNQADCETALCAMGDPLGPRDWVYVLGFLTIATLVVALVAPLCGLR